MLHLSLPPLSDHLEPTRATLHAYALAVGAVPRAHALPHPKWWHISLKMGPTGLTTDRMAYPGGTFRVRMDLIAHDIVLETSRGGVTRLSMREGRTATEMGDGLTAAVADLGLEGAYARDKFESDDARPYDREVAAAYFGLLTTVEWILALHRASLEGDVGPLQVWPHGFDISFEWFGTRTVSREEHGEMLVAPAQLSLGFYPKGEAYFYSNPWPFEPALLDTPLPSGASWHTEGWQGTMLPHAEVAGRRDAAERVLEYARAVFAAASPTLMR
jgi:hypothetical protein